MAENNLYKKSYGLIKANLNILMESDMSAMVVLSPAGLGKTTLIMNTLKERGLQEGIHYQYYNSYFTPLAFYRALQGVNELNRPNLMILDDTEAILRDKNIINLLKAATWATEGQKRTVCYNSTSSKVSNPICDFKGKIIILINESPESNPMFNAIVDRVLFCELQFTQDEILDLMRDEIVKKPFRTLDENKRMMIFNFIKKNVGKETELSFRILIKAYNNYLFAPSQWQELTLQLLKARKVAGQEKTKNNSLI